MDRVEIVKIQTDTQLYFAVYNTDPDVVLVPKIFSSLDACTNFLVEVEMVDPNGPEYLYHYQHLSEHQEIVDFTTAGQNEIRISVEKLCKGENPGLPAMQKISDLWSFLTATIAADPATLVNLQDVMEELATQPMIDFFAEEASETIGEKGWVDIGVHVALNAGIESWTDMLSQPACPRRDIFKYVGESLKIKIRCTNLNAQTFLSDFTALQQRVVTMAFLPQALMTQ